MSQLDGFSGHYSPGGAPKAVRRRWAAQANGQKGGRASAIKRKQLARGKRPPRARSHAQALALAYPVRQLRRREFDRRYAATFPLASDRGTAVASWERGRDTAWEHYGACFKRYRAEGQHFLTTKPQRAKALEHAGRPRCEKTVQRLNDKLLRMGLMAAAHERRGGWRAGNKDLLRMEMRTPPRLGCPTAPPERGLPALRPKVAPPLARKEQTFDTPETATSTDSSPPASPAETDAADAANGNGSDDGGGVEALIADLEERLRFTEMKIRLAPSLGSSAIHRRRELLMEIRALRDGRSPSLRWRGDRC